MINMAKYIMGVAAKSNIEKRQVGCVITYHTEEDNNEVICGEGFNDEDIHAEFNAVEDMMARAEFPSKHAIFKAYVTHPPCPTCAKLLANHTITNIEIVETFMKFDGDKLRFDLIDGKFMLELLQYKIEYNSNIDWWQVKEALYRYEAKPEHDIHEHPTGLKVAILLIINSYADWCNIEKALAKVLTFGARKYKPGNWKKCTDTGRYLAAAHRHLNALLYDEGQCDEETGFDHKDHLITNLMFLYVLGLHIGE